MTNGTQGSPAPTGKHLIAWFTVAISMALFLCLLIGIAVAPDFLAVSAFGGLTRGHALVLFLHIAPVAAVWFYIYRGPEPKQ
jgi:hypothetical protein